MIAPVEVSAYAARVQAAAERLADTLVVGNQVSNVFSNVSSGLGT
jgi:hypothetical protein